jgi:hypothetical protein
MERSTLRLWKKGGQAYLGDDLDGQSPAEVDARDVVKVDSLVFLLELLAISTSTSPSPSSESSESSSLTSTLRRFGAVRVGSSQLTARLESSSYAPGFFLDVLFPSSSELIHSSSLSSCSSWTYETDWAALRVDLARPLMPC